MCRKFTRMLDTTLASPFFPRRADGAIAYGDEDELDPEGMAFAVDLDINLEDSGDEEGYTAVLPTSLFVPVHVTCSQRCRI